MNERKCVRCDGPVPEHFSDGLDVCFSCRLKDVTALEEEISERSWWYLSFADDKFLGACVVEGAGVVSATQRAWDLGINPGGQVLGIPVPAGKEDVLPRNRLLSKAELAEFDELVEIQTGEDDGQETD